jgi:hypothetical protein
MRSAVAYGRTVVISVDGNRRYDLQRLDACGVRKQLEGVLRVVGDRVDNAVGPAGAGPFVPLVVRSPSEARVRR